MDRHLKLAIDRTISQLSTIGVEDFFVFMELLSLLIYLKMFDEQETELAANGAARFPTQTQRYRWSQWNKQRLDIDDLRYLIHNEVFPYMASLQREAPAVAEFFQSARIEPVTHELFEPIYSFLDQINFYELAIDNKGEVVDYFLTHLIPREQRSYQVIPPHIRALMVELAAPQWGERIVDPACATGGLLMDAVRYIVHNHSDHPQEVPIYGEEWLEKRGQSIDQAKAELPTLQTFRRGRGESIPDWEHLRQQIFGYDISRRMTRISKINLILNGIEQPQIRRVDTLAENGGLTPNDFNRKYDVVLSKIPFSGDLVNGNVREDILVNSLRNDLLFLGLAMQSLSDRGRGVLLVRDEILSESTAAARKLRERLIEEYCLLAVISLPDALFNAHTLSREKTSVLVFKKGQGQGDQGERKVWFYEVSADGYDTTRAKGSVRAETPDRNDIPELLKQWKQYRDSDYKRVPGVPHDEPVTSEEELPKSYYVPISTVRENRYLLQASRYRPIMVKTGSKKHPADVIQQMLKLEEGIVEDLKKLLENLKELG